MAQGPDDAPCATRATDIDVVTRLVELHLRFHTYRMGWTDRAVRRYVRDAGPLLDQPERADALRLHHPQPPTRPRRSRVAWTSSSSAHRGAARAGGARRDPARRSTARQVMEHLGMAPGPAVGRALDFLLELRLEEGPLGEDEVRRAPRTPGGPRRAPPG